MEAKRNATNPLYALTLGGSENANVVILSNELSRVSRTGVEDMDVYLLHVQPAGSGVCTASTGEISAVSPIAGLPTPAEYGPAQDAGAGPGRNAHSLAPRRDATQHGEAGYAPRLHGQGNDRSPSGTVFRPQAAPRRLLLGHCFAMVRFGRVYRQYGNLRCRRSR